MIKLFSKIVGALSATFLMMGTAIAHDSPAAVPEIDGSMAVIALGLTAAIVAIIKESRRK